ESLGPLGGIFNATDAHLELGNPRIVGLRLGCRRVGGRVGILEDRRRRRRRLGLRRLDHPEEARGRLIMGEAPDRGGGSCEEQHQPDQQACSPAHAAPVGATVHYASGLLHSRVASASKASSVGRSATSTASQPWPAASAAAGLIAAIAMEARSLTSSAKRRAARGEWVKAMVALTSVKSGAATGFER